jgi:hypothetical protein
MAETLVKKVLDDFSHSIHLPAELIDFRQLLHLDFIGSEDSFFLLVDVVL